MAIDVRQPALHMTWEEDDLVLSLAPLQGRWTVEQYLLLSDQTRRPIEFTDGYMELLPMPTDSHQVILRFMFLALYSFLQSVGGMVLFAPLRLQIRAGKFREPNILLVRRADDPRRQERYWLGADLVVEIVSPDNPQRDTAEKRADYAAAGIPEYWLANPGEQSIAVLVLAGEHYAEHGVFHRGELATSVALPSFTIVVSDLFDAR